MAKGGGRMNVNQLFPSKWVKAPDLNGKRVPVTIRQVTIEEVQGDNGKEKVPAVWFKGAAKALLMNKTIAMQIAALHGPETDGWAGKRITLYATRVKAFGKTHDVIRVDDKVPPMPQNGAKDNEEQIANETLNDHEDIADEAPDDFDRGNPPEDGGDKPPAVSQAQLTKLSSLGRQFYGADEWKEAGPKAVAWKTSDRTKVAEELTAEEADALIASLERKIVEAAAKAQSAPKPKLNEEDKALWAKDKPAPESAGDRPDLRLRPVAGFNRSGESAE